MGPRRPHPAGRDRLGLDAQVPTQDGPVVIEELDEFRSWLADLDAGLPDVEDGATLNEVFIRLHDLKAEIDIVARAAMTRAAELMGDDEGRAVEDGRVLEVEWKPRRTNWDSVALRDEVLGRSLDHLVADENGEIDPVRIEMIPLVVEAIMSVWSLPGYDAKKGGLTKLGIEPGEFCETTWTKALKVRPAPEELEIPE